MEWEQKIADESSFLKNYYFEKQIADELEPHRRSMFWDCLVACEGSFFAFRLKWKVGPSPANSFSISDESLVFLASDLTLVPECLFADCSSL